MYRPHLSMQRPFLALFALLAIVFGAETAAMWLVSAIFPDSGRANWRETLVDALTVVLLSGPFVWWLAIHPLAAALRGGYRFSQTLFDNPGALVVVLDRDGRIVSFNPGCEKATGYAAAEVTGHLMFDLLIPEDARAQVREVFAQCTSGGEFPHHFQNEWLSRNGERRWIAWTNDVLRDDAGRIEYVVANGLDLTELRRQEQQLLDSEARLRALIEATGESAILMDLDGKVLDLNRVAATRLGGTPECLIGRNAFDLIPPQVAAARRRHFDQMAVDGHSVTFEDERNGMRMRHSMVPIKDERGAVKQAAIFAEDITEATMLRRTDNLLHGFDQQVLGGRSFDEILGFACEQLVRVFGYEAVWIGRKMADGSVDLRNGTGTARDYVEAIRNIGVRWDDTPMGQGATGVTIRSGEARVFHVSDAELAPWAQTAKQFGLRSALGLPLIVSGEVFGALVLYSSDDDAFTGIETVGRLHHIGARLNVVIETAEKLQQMQLLRQAIETAGSGILVTRRDGIIEWSNRALRQMTGYSESELMGNSPRLFKSGRQDAAYYRRFWEILARGDTWRGETVNKRKDGSLLTVMQIVAPVRGIGGEVSHYISVMEDISLRKEAEEKIRHLAEHDALTDLPNRVLMQARLAQMLTGEKRRRQELVGVLYLDVDRFKQINDRHGHDVGDALLRGFADRLRGVVRAEDTVARVGGDEFVVLLPGMQRVEDAETVARKLLASLESPIDCLGLPLRIGSSIGIAYAPSHDGEPVALLKCADVAMYAAKRAGRNTYRIFDATMAVPST